MFASSSQLRVVSVEIIVQNVTQVVHAVESNCSDYIQTNAFHGNNATRYGNKRLPLIDRMTVSPDTYFVCAKAAG